MHVQLNLLQEKGIAISMQIAICPEICSLTSKLWYCVIYLKMHLWCFLCYSRRPGFPLLIFLIVLSAYLKAANGGDFSEGISPWQRERLDSDLKTTRVFYLILLLICTSRSALEENKTSKPK